jgi:hypothetical protein
MQAALQYFRICVAETLLKTKFDSEKMMNEERNGSNV